MGSNTMTSRINRPYKYLVATSIIGWRKGIFASSFSCTKKFMQMFTRKMHSKKTNVSSKLDNVVINIPRLYEI